MNKKVLVIAVALMVVAMLATPVLADSPKKIPVTATQAGGQVEGPDSRTWTTEGGIVQYKDWLGSGSIKLDLPSSLGGTLMGSSTSVVSFSKNTKTGVGVVHIEMTWTFTDGTFEGIDEMKNYYIEGIKEAHVVMHGTGDYEGWVLILSGTATPAPMKWEGDLLIP